MPTTRLRAVNMQGMAVDRGSGGEVQGRGELDPTVEEDSVHSSNPTRWVPFGNARLGR